MPTASIENVTVSEGAGTMTFTLLLSHLSDVDTAYSTISSAVSGTATVTDDYDDFKPGTTSARFTVLAGQLSATFDITIEDDTVKELDETIYITWDRSGTNVTTTMLYVIGTITDNDTTGRVTGVTVTPGNTKLVVNWTAVDDATGYKVQWKSGFENYNTGNRQDTVSSGTTTSHTITGLTNGTLYYLQETATRTGFDDGEPSEEKTARPVVGEPGVTAVGDGADRDRGRQDGRAATGWRCVLSRAPVSR